MVWEIWKFKKIHVTHADADHSGAGGLFDTASFMHKGTLDAIKKTNRAYGSSSQSSVLEEVYTKLINLFSESTLQKMWNVLRMGYRV